MRRVVTIDGPAGAGKSTVARRLADRLGWRFLDTGAMYRAVTLAALRTAIDLSSDQALGELASDSPSGCRRGRLLLDDEDVTAAIRSVEVTRASRFVADSPSVRDCGLPTGSGTSRPSTTPSPRGATRGRSCFPTRFASSS